MDYMDVGGSGGTNNVLGERIKLIDSKVKSKIFFFKDAMTEYVEIKSIVDDLAEEKERMEQERHSYLVSQKKQEHHRKLFAASKDLVAPPCKDLLASLQEDFDAAKEEFLQAKEQIVQVKKEAKEQIVQAKKEAEEQLAQKCKELEQIVQAKKKAEEQLAQKCKELDQKNGELESIRRKTQEGETNITEVHEQQHGTSPEPIQFIGAQTRSMLKQTKVQQSGRQLMQSPNVYQRVTQDDDLEAVREELIKGFLKIDMGGRKLGIKEMGKLNEKEFQAACLAKLPLEEAGAASSKLYSSWQQQLSDLRWNPFKMDGNCQEIVNVDDEKLQELKRAWGEGAYKAVINALMEMKEYSILSDRSVAYELWNYKDGRKATLSECVEYMVDQVESRKVVKRRRTRRW